MCSNLIPLYYSGVSTLEIYLTLCSVPKKTGTSTSGQSVNLNKSEFQTTTNVTDARRNDIQRELKVVFTTNLENYLGCPIVNGRMNKRTFEELIIKSKKQLQKWKANTLSQEGRSLLIKTNLCAKPLYTMQSFLLPKSILKELDDINKQFYWNKGEKHRALIHWDDICRSKENGGAGIRKAEEINIAMQQKLLWKIIAEPENIWVQIIREKYLKEETLFNYKKKGSTSYQWGKLITLREQFVKGLKWVVGDGKAINF